MAKEDGTELLRKYRDDTMKAIAELEPKLKDTGLLENEFYQKLKTVYLAHLDAPEYYSFGYFIYGYLEGKGVSAKELMGEEEYDKFLRIADGEGTYRAWKEWADKAKKLRVELAATKHDPISPPDPNNPPDPNDASAR
jgi:hypothetical protein